MNKFELHYKDIKKKCEGDPRMEFKKIADELENKLRDMGLDLPRHEGPRIIISEQMRRDPDTVRRSRQEKASPSFGVRRQGEIYLR